MDGHFMTYTPDPENIELFDIYYELSRIEFFACVCAIALSFITGLLIWHLIVKAKNEKQRVNWCGTLRRRRRRPGHAPPA